MNYLPPSRNNGTGLGWKYGPPRGSRAADARSLGGLGATAIEYDTNLPSPLRIVAGAAGGKRALGGMPLPAPGAPEPLLGLGCSGGCGGDSYWYGLSLPVLGELSVSGDHGNTTVNLDLPVNLALVYLGIKVLKGIVNRIKAP